MIITPRIKIDSEAIKEAVRYEWRSKHDRAMVVEFYRDLLSDLDDDQWIGIRDRIDIERGLAEVQE